jgi:ankyrin repeat protein
MTTLSLSSIMSILSMGVNVNQQDFFGKTALMHMVEKSSYESCVFLIENGANVNLTDDKGWTVLPLCVTNSLPFRFSSR